MLLAGGFFLLGVRIEELIQFTVLYWKYWVSYNIYKVPSTLKVYVTADLLIMVQLVLLCDLITLLVVFWREQGIESLFVLLLCGTCTHFFVHYQLNHWVSLWLSLELAFLLSVASAKHVGVLHALSVSESCWLPEYSGVVLWPNSAFLPKVVLPQFVSPLIWLPFNCPLSTLKSMGEFIFLPCMCFKVLQNLLLLLDRRINYLSARVMCVKVHIDSFTMIHSQVKTYF